MHQAPVQADVDGEPVWYEGAFSSTPSVTCLREASPVLREFRSTLAGANYRVLVELTLHARPQHTCIYGIL